MRYFLGFLAAIGLIVVVFILILRGFSDRTPAAQIELLDYVKTDTAVQLTVDGPVTAEQTHQRYRITVDRYFSSIETMQGYEGKRTDFRTYPSNETAYANFLRSLELVGFIKGNTDPLRADERGQCPDGSRYIYEIVSDNRKIQRFWSTSCGRGTYGGNAAQTRQLFLRQIPEASLVLDNFTDSF
jgi:hypothetical protein